MIWMKVVAALEPQPLCRETADNRLAEGRIKNASRRPDLLLFPRDIFHLREHLWRGAHHGKAAMVVAHRGGHCERHIWIALNFLERAEPEMSGRGLEVEKCVLPQLELYAVWTL